MEKTTLLLDSARGQYIPRDFVTGFDLSKFYGISQDDVECCKNPENESYWDSWVSILDNAKFVENGRVFTLYQDGDLWLLCLAELTSNELSNFGFEV